MIIKNWAQPRVPSIGDIINRLGTSLNRVWWSNERKWSNKPWETSRNLKWKKPVWKSFILYASIRIWHWEMQNHHDCKQIIMLPGVLGVAEESWLNRPNKGIFKAVKLFYMIRQWGTQDFQHLSKSTELYSTKNIS